MTPPSQQQRPTTQQPQIPQQVPQTNGPAPDQFRLPLNSFPPAVQQALKKSWDKEGSGFVTVGELCAGANGDNSARNSRQQRTLSSLGKYKQQVARQQAGKADKFYSELPGDLSVLDSLGLGEGQGIWERMAAIIRRQRLDVRILLDAHDRRNAGLVDLETFRRALCYAFGNHWTELAMTSPEFDELAKPYLTRNPNKPGEPNGFVFWQKFATDLQTLADRRTHSDDFMARLVKIEAKERVAAKILREYGISEYDLKTTFAQLKHTLNAAGGGNSGVAQAFRRMDGNHSGTIRAEEIKKFLTTMSRGLDDLNMKTLDAIVDMCDSDGDGEIDYNEISRMVLCDDILELLALVPDKSTVHKGQSAKNQIIGSRNVTVGELQSAQQVIKKTLMNKHGTVFQALRSIDTKGDGSLSRQEVIDMLQKHLLIKHIDYYTGAMHGEITMAAADTLMDLVDSDKDGKLNYQEFTRVLVSEDIMLIPAPKSTANISNMWGDGR